MPVTVKAVRESYAATPVMPVIDGEASYEMLNDSLPTEWTRRMFWLCLMNGAAGHTYGANGIWQCNRPDQPHGNSPHGGTYGKIPWNEAMHLPGSQQLGLGKKLLEQYPWQRFQPHPEWAAFASGSLLSLDGCQWIWFPEGNPAQDAPVAKRFCRRTFVLPAGKAIERARLRVSADDWFAARLNGEALGTGDDWHVGRQFEDLAQSAQAGHERPRHRGREQARQRGGKSRRLDCLPGSPVCRRRDPEAGFRRHWRWSQERSQRLGYAPASTMPRGPRPWPSAVMAMRRGAKSARRTMSPSARSARAFPASCASSTCRKPTHVVRRLDRNTTYARLRISIRSAARSPRCRGYLCRMRPVVWSARRPGLSHDWVLVTGKCQGLKSKVQSLRPPGNDAHELTLANDQLAWHFDWSDGRLRSSSFENKLSGRRFALSGVRELALNFSAAPDRVAQPFVRAADFEVRAARLAGAHHAVFDLRSPSLAIGVGLACRAGRPHAPQMGGGDQPDQPRPAAARRGVGRFHHRWHGFGQRRAAAGLS